jgi:hypothetical protein
VRVVFLLLVLANLAFFAWARYFSPADAGTDARPLARQIEPDKLKVVSPAELSTMPLAQKKPLPPQAAPVLACIEWGGFAPADLPRAEKALEPLGLGARLGQRRSEELASWWVHIPAQPTRQAAINKAAELKNLGVQDYFVVTEEGPHRWAVSLGVFRTEEAAQAHLALLHGRGVRSARVSVRETMVPKVWLQVKSVDAALEARLKELVARVEPSELKPCP